MTQIKFLHNAKIINKENEKYLVKRKRTNIEKIYEKLKNRDFHNFIEPIELNRNEEIYPYVEELSTTENDRALDLIYLASILHSKTTTFKKVQIDTIKERYEKVIDKLNETFTYYSKLQDDIEEHIYMSPAEQLLMKNISKIYYMLNTSREFIEKYYQESEQILNERESLIHGSLSLDHIIEGENKYLISWNNSRKDLPIYDLINFYRKDYDKVNMESLFDVYLNRYNYTIEEKYLFFSLINIPNILKFDKSNFTNTINARKLVDYIDKTISFTSKEYKENEKSNNEEFK